MAAADELGGTVVRQWIPLQRQLVPATKDATEAYRRHARRRQKEAIQNALNKGYLKTLDKDLVLTQWSRTDEEGSSECLERVLRVSLPSSRVQAIDDMALLSCPRLRLCNLPNCFVNDMAAFYGCVNLLKLDLSNNQIGQLPKGDFWLSLSSLRALYLHGNSISDRSCLQQLNLCPRLHILTLHSTPLSLLKNYRHYIVNGVMSLQALDEHVVSDEEIIESMSLQGTFQTSSPQLRLQLYTPYSKETNYASELQGAYSLLLAVDRTLAHYSPVHIVQRWMRGWLTRRALAASGDNRIRSLLSKHKYTNKRAHSMAPPPPPSTAVTQQLPVSQTGPTQSTLSSQHVLTKVPWPSHIMHPTSAKQKEINFKTTLSVSLPAPPPTSPTFHSPRTRERTSNNLHLSISPQRNTSSLPIESYTVVVDPESPQLCHSLCVNLNPLQQSVCSPRGTDTDVKSKQKGSLQPDRQRPTKKGKRSLERERELVRDDKEEEIERANRMTVTGRRREVMVEENCTKKMVRDKEEDGKRLREAEEQIMETVAKTREPPSKDLRRVDPPTTIHGAPRLGKDTLAFSRVFESVTLSTLKAVDKIHETERMRENWNRKATHVVRMRNEREVRRRKIQDIRQKTKETIEAWRIMEENKVARLLDQNAEQASRNLLERSIQRCTASEDRKKEVKDRAFAAEFSQQAVSIGREVAKEDREISTEDRREEIKRQVEQVTEATRQRREEARTEKEIRNTQLVWEGALAKKELNGKIVQAAVQRMTEAKRRVARALNRRAAATASVAKAKETLRNNASRGTTLNGTLPPLELDLRTKSELAEACTDALKVATTEASSCPFRLRRFTHEANRSWQRGTIVLAERERQVSSQTHPPATYFPTIDETAAHTTYPQLRPGRILQSLVSTPFQSEVTELSPTPSTESCDCTTRPHPFGVA